MARTIFQKTKKSQQIEIVPKDENPPLPAQRQSDELISKKVIYRNKRRFIAFVFVKL